MVDLPVGRGKERPRPARTPCQYSAGARKGRGGEALSGGAASHPFEGQARSGEDACGKRRFGEVGDVRQDVLCPVRQRRYLRRAGSGALQDAGRCPHHGEHLTALDFGRHFP